MANNIVEGSLINHTYEEVSTLLDQMNMPSHAREADVVGSASIQTSSTKERLKEEAKQERMAKFMTQIQLLTRHVMDAPKHKVNVVPFSDQGYKHEDAYHNYELEVHYINNYMGGFHLN